MANQSNFKTNVTNQGSVYPKYTVSRIVDNLNNDLIRMEIPTDFTFIDVNDVVVEFSLYSLYNNSLVLSGIAKNDPESGIKPISTQTLSYSDNSSRTLLYINFTELPNIIFPEGTYQLVLNIFVNEIGSYDTRILRVTKISPSRKEVELAIIPPTQDNLTTVKNYIDRSINSTYILPVIKEIYGKLEEGVYIPTNRIGMTTESVFNAIPSSSKLQDYNFEVDSADGKYGINTLIQNILDDAYLYTSSSMSVALSNNSSSFSYETIYQYVTASILVAYENVMDDNLQNPFKYRFDLI